MNVVELSNFGQRRLNRRPRYAAAYWLLAILVVLAGSAARRFFRYGQASTTRQAGDRGASWIASQVKGARVKMRSFGERLIDRGAESVFEREAWFNSLAIDPKKGRTILADLSARRVIERARSQQLKNLEEHDARREELLQAVDSLKAENSRLAEDLAGLNDEIEKRDPLVIPRLMRIKAKLEEVRNREEAKREHSP